MNQGLRTAWLAGLSLALHSAAWAHGDEKQGGVIVDNDPFHVEATVRKPNTEIRAYVRGKVSHVGIPLLVEKKGVAYFELDNDKATALSLKSPDLERGGKKYYQVDVFLKESGQEKELKMTPVNTGKYPYFSFPAAYGGRAFTGSVILRFKDGEKEFRF